MPSGRNASYVLDTHACVFALGAPTKLGKKARSAMQAVEEGRSEAWIPAAVVAEVILLRELGRIEIGLAQLKTAMEEAPGLRFLSMDLRQLDEFAALGAIRDPFDRLIVSAARAVGAKLLTRDRSLGENALVQTVWS
jgi:PIN domain nuclease of toxin-antitoxin system